MAEEKKLMLLEHWFADLQDLTEEEQNQVCANVIMYGLYGMMPDRGSSAIKVLSKGITKQIDATQAYYEKAKEQGKKGGHKTEIDAQAVYELAMKGMTAEKIAQQLGYTSKDSIYGTPGWKKAQADKKTIVPKKEQFVF